MKNNIKKIVSAILIMVSPALLLAADVSVVPTAKDGDDNINMFLVLVAIILLLPLYVASKAFVLMMKDYVDKQKNTSSGSTKKIVAVFVLLCISQLMMAQATSVPPPAVEEVSHWLKWTLISVILFEALVIAYFSRETYRLISKYSPEKEEAIAKNVVEKQPGMFGRLWAKMNSFKSTKEEADMDTGHNYDGIRELDNVIPPWFSAAFIITILIAVGYLYTYHIAKSAPLQIAEFNAEMKEAEAAKAAQLTNQANAVDENTVTMLGASEIAEGKKNFTIKCSPCHGPDGGSKPGGIGPNLTDEYWIHGGTIKDIFKSIKYGWPDKGMVPWKDAFSATQIAQLASFVKSIKGSKNTGGKEPQGELMAEEKATGGAKDSAAVKK